MKPIYTIILISLCSFCLAQPVINEYNMPILGDSVVIAICSDPANPGNAGAMQTWDFSTLTETEEQSFVYVDPATTPKADSFPDANLCAINWQGDYSYYRVTPGALETVGHAAQIPPSDTGLFVYSNFEQVVGFPYTYNDEFLDNFVGVNYIPNAGVFNFDGSLDFEADGYGTLILPNGTYSNVVRYHFNRSQTNYFNGFPAGTQTKEQWAWVSEDYRFWLLLMEENFDGFSTTSLVWYDKNPYSVVTNTPENSLNKDIAVFPNPLAQGSTLNIQWPTDETATVEVKSMDGKLVYSEPNVLTNGYNALNIPEFEVGLYVLSVSSENHLFNQRICIVR